MAGNYTDRNEQDYFIPYVLPIYISKSEGDELISQYSCLQVVQLLQQLPQGWNHVLAQKDIHHTCSNLITFCLPGAYFLSLLDKLSYFEVQIRHQKADYYQQCPVHLSVQDILSSALAAVCEQLSYNNGRIRYGFHCKCGEMREEHIAAITRLTPPFDYALCKYGSIVTTALKHSHIVEVKKSSQVDSKNAQIPPKPGDQSPEYVLMKRYHNKLLKILPVCDLSPYFVSEKVISLADNDKIVHSSTSQAAAQLILDKVLLQIQNGNTEIFYKMLLIMEHYGTDAAETLSAEIKRKCEEKQSANSTVYKQESHFHTTREETVSPTREETEDTESLLPECEVFIQYYSQIVNNMSAKSLAPHFVAHKIISPDDQEEISSVASSKKAAMLLLSRVSSALEAGIVKSFYKFLDITEHCGSNNSRTVSLAITEKLLKIKGNQEEIGPTLVERGLDHTTTVMDNPPDMGGANT
ncbi:uncharacterized protein [Dysidea avara]|uniref:uncharacterized protein isoform X2 n=1 Tax=Dysidea avara TaxID=196820 RepID=UPI00331FD4FC